jgi:transposase-like protein
MDAAPRTLQQAILYFSHYENCHKALVAVRWPDGVVKCPTCGSEKVTYLASAKVWKCYEKHPRAKFSLKVGTVFEDSPLPLQKWLPALWLLTNCRNGISSYELARALGVTQKSAWFMLQRLRLALQSKSGGKIGGTIEVDETYIGGKSRNMRIKKRKQRGISQGTSMAGKVAVMALLDRHGRDGVSQVRLSVVEGRKKHHFNPFIDQHIERGAIINTDSHASYGDLPRHYDHKVIDHAEKYVDGEVHTNSCENFWSLLKRSIKGTYVSVEPFHLFRYLDEQAFRFNERSMKDAGRFFLALAGIVNRRLTYKALIGSELPQTC